MDRAPVAALLARERWILSASIALATLAAWFWLLRTTSFLNPVADPAGSMAGMPMAPSEVPFASYVGAAFVMWWLMMVAMMLPSAAPMILLYARFARAAQRQRAVIASAWLFAFCYLAVWAGFSLVAALAQAALVATGAVSREALVLSDARAAGVLLLAAGLYSFTPLRRACLANCRSPLTFLMRYWRGTTPGIVRLGLLHGLYCVGCCWLLMALLFIGGVMNLAWIVALSLIVLAEKLLPHGERVGGWIGAAVMVAGLLMVAKLAA